MPCSIKEAHEEEEEEKGTSWSYTIYRYLLHIHDPNAIYLSPAFFFIFHVEVIESNDDSAIAQLL